MLDVCHTLLKETPGALFTSHVNESPGEIDFVKNLFPDARDYVDTYERAGLLGAISRCSPTTSTSPTRSSTRLADARTAVAHCPSSNAFLASGIFPMARHVAAGVRFGMGTDVGAGTGLSMLKEGLVAYHVQMVRDRATCSGPEQLLWLATAAGADALGLDDVCGDLSPGKQADIALIKPPPDRRSRPCSKRRRTGRRRSARSSRSPARSASSRPAWRAKSCSGCSARASRQGRRCVRRLEP